MALIAAGADSFHAYSSGIFDDEECGIELTHTVLITGYGSESGVNSWILKNSWGTSWGEKGYMRLKINASGYGVCGLTYYNLY